MEEMEQERQEEEVDEDQHQEEDMEEDSPWTEDEVEKLKAYGYFEPHGRKHKYQRGAKEWEEEPDPLVPLCRWISSPHPFDIADISLK